MRFVTIGLALALLSSGCKQKDGDILAAVFQKAGKKIGAITGDAPANITSSVRESMGEASLAARVQNRLRWDRFIGDVTVNVQTTAVGTVTLSGIVPDLAVKQRMIDLAKATVGVKNVEDKLVLRPE